MNTKLKTFVAAFSVLAGSLAAARAQSTAGNVDGAFNPQVNGAVLSSTVQGDDKIIIGGDFTQVNGAARNHVARLNADGTLDQAFQAITTGSVTSVALQSDGKILLAVSGSQAPGTAARTLVRQNPNGTLVRLNPDGTLDSTFQGAAAVAGATINALIVQPDNKILVGGSPANQPTPIAIRLNADGTADGGFSVTLISYDSGNSFGGTVRTLALQPDGKVIVGGRFGYINGMQRQGLARLNGDGTLDDSFDAGYVLAPAMSEVNSPLIASAALEPSGKIIVGGDFRTGNQGNAINNIARLNSDGSLDETFSATANDTVNSVKVQNDGQVLISGFFTMVNLVPHQSFMRLTGNGSLDNGFDLGVGPTVSQPYQLGLVDTFALQPDGKIIVGGRFDSFGGTPRANIARLLGTTVHPPFFNGEVALSNGVYYLAFPNGTPYGYYAYLSDARYLYHFDLGYEYWLDANDGGGIYFYDFASGGYFYTSPSFPFPYLYDFSLGAVLYYYPDPTNPQRYNTNGTRYFYNFRTQQIITK